MNKKSAKPNQEHQAMLESISVGIDYCVKLSYSAIDQSDLTFDEKRSLLFSVYCFRCLFDSAEMNYVNTLLKKYKCTFSMPLESHPMYAQHKDEFEQIKRTRTVKIPYGGLYVADDDDYVVRYDAGSPVWEYLFNAGKLDGADATLPQKYDLYDMAYRIISLSSCSDELKAMWYMSFPYIMIMGAPHDVDIYDELFNQLAKKRYFDICLTTTYSVYIHDSIDALNTSEVPSIIVSWYEPYITYKNQTDEEGLSREAMRYRSWIGQGRFSHVYAGTEKLLNTFPDDDNLILCNIASRFSLEGTKDGVDREKMFKEVLSTIDAVFERRTNKPLEFTYYKAMCYLGLQNIERAYDLFNECLTIKKDHEPALKMLNMLNMIASKKGS